MRVFVAGATGAIGRPLVSALLSARHEVVGMTSSDHGLTVLQNYGADGPIVDAFDPGGVTAAINRVRPSINHQRHAPRLDGCSEFREQPSRIQPCSCAVCSNLIGILPAAEMNTMHSHDQHLLSRNSNCQSVHWPSHTSANANMAFVERHHHRTPVHPNLLTTPPPIRADDLERAHRPPARSRKPAITVADLRWFRITDTKPHLPSWQR
jgi:hypothetical protein